MGRAITLSVVAVMGVLFAITLMAGETPSAGLGEKLFKDSTLGGSQNTKSCNTCHPDGKGLESAGSNPDLAATINRCIAGPLKGKKIPEDSVEMKSLVLYIQSLQDNE
jgi:cytochrome c peroxidase